MTMEMESKMILIGMKSHSQVGFQMISKSRLFFFFLSETKHILVIIKVLPSYQKKINNKGPSLKIQILIKIRLDTPYIKKKLYINASTNHLKLLNHKPKANKVE